MLASHLRRLLGGLVLLLVCTPSALADGKVFAADAVDPFIPDQSAMIVFEDGVETLVIETSFEGRGSEFAWVVPVPSEPEVFEVQPGVFASLRAVFRPRVSTAGSGAAQVVVLLMVCLLLPLAGAALVRPCQSFRAMLATAFAGVVVASALVVLTPTLGKARGVSGPEVATDPLVSRERIGAYDVAVLRPTEPGSAGAWLEQAGFGVPDEAAPVLAGYERDGWFFVATRLRVPERAEVAGRPTPLGVRFASERPVYPMRLTSIGEGGSGLALELFVFADGVARESSLRVARAGPCVGALPRASGDPVRLDNGRLFVDFDGTPMFRTPDPAKPKPGPGIRLEHAALRTLVDPSLHGTRLRATLSPSQMRDDLTLTIGERVTRRDVVRSEAAAWGIGVRVGVGVALIGVVALLGVRLRRDPPANPVAIALLGVLVLSSVVGWVVIVSLDGVEVVEGRPASWYAREVQESVLRALLEGQDAEDPAPVDAPRLDAAYEEALDGWRDPHSEWRRRPERGEPWSVFLEGEGDETMVVWLDGVGRARSARVYDPSADVSRRPD